MEKNAIVIFNAGLARYLLKQGYRIIDIKPCKEDKTKTFFVFKIEDGLLDIVDNYKK